MHFINYCKMKPILEVNGISKKFTIRHKNSAYLSLRDTLSSPGNLFNESSEEFYALKNISFNVNKGESVGIIGKNGAGKSTLLKILSKITPPTSGSITSRGRIASLLEVGTGFHPELSGRENIFLNGSILGMKKNEIADKFNEIVDFSGVEKFLDTPLKHFSSGMQLRLAFAVAAFLEPEILIIDEVLAVGDAEFQKKCIQKMDSITHDEGRTILIVSHNMSVLKKLCSKAIMLHDGEIVKQGMTDEIVSHYLHSAMHAQPEVRSKGGMSAQKLQIRNSDGNIISSFNTFDDVTFELSIDAKQNFENVTVAVCFDNSDEVRILSLWSKLTDQYFKISEGKFIVSFRMPEAKLLPGEYNVVTYIESNGMEVERIDRYTTFTVGFKPGKHYTLDPSSTQSLYLENFEVTLQNKTHD